MVQKSTNGDNSLQFLLENNMYYRLTNLANPIIWMGTLQKPTKCTFRPHLPTTIAYYAHKSPLTHGLASYSIAYIDISKGY